MKKIKVKIQGVSPLRHNKFNEANPDGDKTKSANKMTVEDKKEDAYNRSYHDTGRGYYIPAHAIKACIRDAGGQVKLQGKSMMKNAVKAILIVEDSINPIEPQDHKIMSDAVRIPPRTGSRVTQYWVAHPEWSCEFNLIILDDSIQINKVHECLEIGGMYKGLLDGRPEYGRFVVDEFELVKE